MVWKSILLQEDHMFNTVTSGGNRKSASYYMYQNLCAANTHQEQLLIPEILFIKGGTGVSVNSSAKQSLVVVIKGSIKGSALIQLVESEQ